MADLALTRRAPDLSSDRRLWLWTFGVCALVFAFTAQWTSPDLDSLSAAWPAWSLVHRGTLNLAGIHGLAASSWFIPFHGQLLSNRQIGVVLAGVPANALLGWTGLSAYGAAALTAVLMASAAVATLAVVFRSFVDLRWALAGAAVVGFGTAVWTAASEELWTHTPDALFLSLSLLALSRRRYALAGLAFVPAILTRPHLALAGVAIALWLAARQRSWRPLVAIGMPVIVGLALLTSLNHLIWHHWSLTGGYGAVGYSVSTAAGGGALATVRGVATNVAGALFSPRCGLFVFTPVVLIGVLGLRRGFRSAPDWTQAAAAGAVVYELAQCKLNQFTGGSLFFSNRLIIEPVVLAAPLLVHCARAWATTRPRWSVAVVLATVSVCFHAIGALLPIPGSSPAYIRPWDYWLLPTWIANGGTQGLMRVALVALAGLTVLLKLLVSSDARPESSPLPGGSRAEPAPTA